MRALLKKDICTGLPMFIAGAVCLLILVLIYSVIGSERVFDIISTVFLGFACITFFILFSNDASTKFTEYALTLPIKRCRLVDIRYLEAMIICAVAFLISLLSHSDDLVLRIALPATQSIAIAFILPFLYKFGGNSGKSVGLCTFIAFIIAFGSILLLDGRQGFPLAALYPAAAVTLLISWQISRKVITTRDF
jgi:hypothetical protein